MNVERPPHDNEFFTFTYLGQVIVKLNETVEKAKEAIVSKLSPAVPNSVTKFRLREKLAEKLTTAYADDQPLSAYSIHDDKEIAVQITP